MAPSLTASQARGLLAAEEEWRCARQALEAATHRRDTLRRRYRASLTRGDLQVANVLIRITASSTGQTFALKAYLERHELTKAMLPYVSGPSEYERWTVKRVGLVEP